MLSGAPVRPNISLGDSVAGLHAAFGTVRSWPRTKSHCNDFSKVLALLALNKRKAAGSRGGQTVDVSIMERSAHGHF